MVACPGDPTLHTPYEGAVLFVVSTGALHTNPLDPASLGIQASELAWDAVLRAVDNERIGASA